MIRRLIKLVSAVLGIVLILCLLGIAVVWNNRPGMDLVRAHELPPAGADWPAGEVRAVWFGVSTVAISDGEHGILIDPFLSRPGLVDLALNRPLAVDFGAVQAALSRAGIRRLDAMFAGHAHYDHIMDVGAVHRLTGAHFYGSASAVNVAIGHGMPAELTRELPDELPLRIGAFTITQIPSRHAGATGGRPLGEITRPLPVPSTAQDYRQGGTVSILVEHPSGSVLHHGSAGVQPGALHGYPADAVLLGVALIDDLGPYLNETVDRVGATRVIPVHWDDFTRPLTQPISPMPAVVNLPQLFEQLRTGRKDLSVETLPPGVPVTLFPAPGE